MQSAERESSRPLTASASPSRRRHLRASCPAPCVAAPRAARAAAPRPALAWYPRQPCGRRGSAAAPRRKPRLHSRASCDAAAACAEGLRRREPLVLLPRGGRAADLIPLGTLHRTVGTAVSRSALTGTALLRNQPAEVGLRDRQGRCGAAAVVDWREAPARHGIWPLPMGAISLLGHHPQRNVGYAEARGRGGELQRRRLRRLLARGCESRGSRGCRAAGRVCGCGGGLRSAVGDRALRQDQARARSAHGGPRRLPTPHTPLRLGVRGLGVAVCRHGRCILDQPHLPALLTEARVAIHIGGRLEQVSLSDRALLLNTVALVRARHFIISIAARWEGRGRVAVLKGL
eukprot:scaffold13134_cov69-Phaeocystis_antarctica.AAC.14